jgi:tRNA pseudouridine55 synthase
MVLGILTDTLDPEGPITAVDEALSTNNAVQQFINNAKFQRTLLDRFCGEIDQVAPRFSAKKKNGIPMYQLARANEEFEIAPSRVRIDSIEVMAIHQTEWPAIDLQVVCGKGTYIRSLVRDIAEALGTIGYAQLLVRDAIGNFTLDSAVVLDDVSPTHLNRAFSI